MPRIMAEGGPSNADADREAALLLEQMGGSPSAGTSSSASARSSEWSGGSPPDTGRSLQSPVPSAESPSGPDPASSPVPSSTAPLTAGSTQETGSGPESPQDSLAESLAAKPATQGPTEEVPSAGGFPDVAVDAARSKFDAAREAYGTGALDMSEQLLEEALQLDPGLAPNVEAARKAIAAVRSTQA